MRVAMMLYAGFQLLEVSGPMDVFEEANRVCGKKFYEQHVVGPTLEPVVCSNGTAVSTTESLRDLRTAFDIVMVPGSPMTGSAREHLELVNWLGGVDARATKIACVSNGAFLLARAGLADHRCLTMRERDAQRLATDFPLVHVVTESSCLKDGNLYSSDGVSAGVRVALSLVGEDLGRDVANRIAQRLLAHDL
jgi:transcriptional regulator GlxA family with amidase domain